MFFISFYRLLIMFLSLQVSHVSSASDTISVNESLSGYQAIVSSGEVFELGLFTPGTSNYFYIGMWYKQISPRTIVWVGNPDSPAPNTASISLKILGGNLVLHNSFDERIYWSTGLIKSKDNIINVQIQAVLLDNGNLVVKNGSGSSATVLWQSFDHPSDTWLPGAKIWFNNNKRGSQRFTSWNSSEDPSPGRYSLKVEPLTRNSLNLVWNGSWSYWSSGPFNDKLGTFMEVIGTTSRYNVSFELNMTESYITYTVPDQQPFRLVMDASGQFRQYNLLDKLQVWYLSWSAPKDRCEVYGYCGSFGICNANSPDASSCKCAFPTQEHSESSDFSLLLGRCIRNPKHRCDLKNNKFLPLQNIELATDPAAILVSTTTTPCASICLADCSCKAYAYDDNQCLMWKKDAYNLKQLGANDSDGRTFYLRVSTGFGITRTHRLSVSLLAIIITLSSVAVGALFVCLYCYISSPQRRRRRRVQKDKKQTKEILEEGIIDARDDDGQHKFYLNLLDIMAATNAFSEDNKLGEGGFGPVYKGKLPNGTDVAIKRLSKKSSQGLTEFKNEVVLIIKLQHKNLVRLLGYCVEGDEKLLIYEYMSNKSLDALLFDPLKCKELDWEKRMKIVTGTTKGLQYLHEDSRLKIIHRDLKASNILLDDEMNPKISDFGTARIFGCKQIDDSTERIVGTFGYMSPEYALGGMISEKSDIYSFGVLLLELISGKKATRFVHNDQTHSIIAYAWESWCETNGLSIVDEASLGDSYSSKEAMRCVHIALLCVQDHPKDRPAISQIVNMLSNDHGLPVPIQPTFTNVLNRNQQLATPDYVFSINEMTQSTVEGR